MNKKKATRTIASTLTELARRLQDFVRLEPTCIKCGCTEYSACEGGCAWTFLNKTTNEGMCSACFERLLDRHGREEILRGGKS